MLPVHEAVFGLSSSIAWGDDSSTGCLTTLSKLQIVIAAESVVAMDGRMDLEGSEGESAKERR